MKVHEHIIDETTSGSDSDMQKELRKGERNVELDDRKPSTEGTKEPREDCGCILWDLAATESHAELMVCIVWKFKHFLLTQAISCDISIQSKN